MTDRSLDVFAFKGAVFDLDGTLVDSAAVWKNIDIRFFRRRGMDLPEDYAKNVSALDLRAAAEYTRTRFGFSDTPEQMIAEWSDLALYEYSHNVKALPGAGALLKGLRSRGVRLALATASSEPLYAAALRNNGLYELFDAFAVTGEVTRGKGFPDVYLLAAERLGLSPSDCVVFEDIIEGIRGAKAGGFRTVAVLSGAFPDDVCLLESEADLAVNDLSHFPEVTV